MPIIEGWVDLIFYFHYSGIMDTYTAITALSALAQQTRLALFRCLVKAGPEGLAAGSIAEQLEVPANTLSFHLNQLKSAGLLLSNRKSRSIIYSINFSTMQDLLVFLIEDCCVGRCGESS